MGKRSGDVQGGSGEGLMGSSVAPCFMLLIPETFAHLGIDLIAIVSEPHLCQRFEVWGHLKNRL